MKLINTEIHIYKYANVKIFRHIYTHINTYAQVCKTHTKTHMNVQVCVNMSLYRFMAEKSNKKF